MIPDNWLSILDSPSTVALTAPLVMDAEVLVGYALSPVDGYCATLSLDEFMALCPSLYMQVNSGSKHIFHGLKRIWEFLGARGLLPERHEDKDIDINKIDDTKLMAYLLDPDSGREVQFGERRIQDRLTLSNLSVRYLGEDYPYKHANICEKGTPEVFADIPSYDARLIYRLAAELPKLMSKDLYKLYRHLELTLMQVLDRMRRVGIGVNGAACAQEVERVARDMARLAKEITGGAEVDLRSDREVFWFLVSQGVQFQDQRVYQWQKVSAKALEEIAPLHPIVQRILSFREKALDLGTLRQMADQDRVHPVWGQTRSRTSRIYARNPAVQTVSRELRKLFIPAPGHVLVKADYSQAQMRILAHLSQDPELMRIFLDPNGDVHQETSRRLGLNDRNVAKEINFAICFGMGARGCPGRSMSLGGIRGLWTSLTRVRPNPISGVSISDSQR